MQTFGTNNCFTLVTLFMVGCFIAKTLFLEEKFSDLDQNDDVDSEENNDDVDNNEEKLGPQLKKAGWIIILADWCGYCGLQKKMFEEKTELGINEVEGLVLNEKDLPDDHKCKRAVQGFPSFQKWDGDNLVLTKDGYKSNLDELRSLLKM